MHAGRVVRLHADHLDLRPEGLHVGRHPCYQAAATHGHEDGMQGVAVLAHDLHGHRALTGDDLGVVVGVDEAHALRGHQLLSVGEGLVIGVAVQHDLCAETTHGVHLDTGGGLGHDDTGAHAQLARAQCHALGMITRRGRDDASGAFGL